MTRRILGQKFFDRSTKAVARGLLGKFLVRKIRGREEARMITETEAYEGFEDRASHASRGRTKRTEIMFGPPGRFYIYLCYGMYYMLNISTRKPGMPAAVLIRATEGYDGPGKLTRFLHIDKKLNGRKAAKSSGLWVEDRGVRISPRKIKKAGRIGVRYAGPLWEKKELRFTLDN